MANQHYTVNPKQKMGRPQEKVFTPQQKSKALKLRANGVTRRRISIDLGVDYQLLCAWLRTDA